MQSDQKPTTSAMCLSWLGKNVVHEIPIVGHTLTERSWAAFEHDMKHFFSMLVGMVAMMEIPMPLPMTEHEHKAAQFAQTFIFMLLYMYIGMFVGSVFFNVGKTGLSFCKAVLHPVQKRQDDGEQTLLKEHAAYTEYS